MKKPVRKKKPAPKPSGPTMLDRLPKNKGEHIELMIRLTERAIERGNKTMQSQVDRLKSELKEWKSSNS